MRGAAYYPNAPGSNNTATKPGQDTGSDPIFCSFLMCNDASFRVNEGLGTNDDFA